MNGSINKEIMALNHGKRTGRRRGVFGALLLFVAMALPQIALATTGANHIIRNTVTVNYADIVGSAQTPITASVDVTVNLVAAQAVLSAPIDQPTDAATAATYSYTITSQANGPDSYNLTTGVTESAGISGSTATIRNAGDTATIASIGLGGTSVAALTPVPVAGTVAIPVPADSASDGEVNGIAAGDTVVINGAVYTVASVDDANGGTANATSTITVNGNGTPALVQIGDQIGEQLAFLVRVTPGTVTAAVDQTITVDINALDSGAVAPAETDQTITTVTVAALTVVKYVANITDPVAGGGSTVTIDTGGGAGSITYYTSGVTGDPGDTLEYLIEVNNGGTSSATNVVLSDPVPAFTTYTASSMRLDTGTGTFAAVLDGDADADGGETDSATVYFYAGSGGTDGAIGVGNGSGGSLAGGATTYGNFRVTIDN